jgi:hypothetical protein
VSGIGCVKHQTREDTCRGDFPAEMKSGSRSGRPPALLGQRRDLDDGCPVTPVGRHGVEDRCASRRKRLDPGDRGRGGWCGGSASRDGGPGGRQGAPDQVVDDRVDAGGAEGDRSQA